MKDIPEMGVGGHSPVVSIRVNSKGVWVSRGPFEKPIELTITQAFNFAADIKAAIVKIANRSVDLFDGSELFKTLEPIDPVGSIQCPICERGQPYAKKCINCGASL
jgi:hypothetical protein